MRFFLVSLVSFFLTSVAYSETVDERKIKKLLTSKQTWTMYLEYTDQSTPTEQANKFVWEYFERDGKLFTRRRGLAFGGCDSELLVRADGFGFRWCDPQLSGCGPSLQYDPNDAKYPFKSLEPRKVWLQPNE
jgi:hypothetical protein